MDYIQPPEQIDEIVAIAEIKANLPIKAMLLRGMLAGAILGFAILFAWRCTIDLSQSTALLAGSLIFPAGFTIITLLGLELATGNYAVVTLGWLQKKVTLQQLLRNWFWVGVGNLIGSLIAAFLFIYAIGPSDLVLVKVKTVALQKTIAYAQHGGAGWFEAFVRGILCNTMVGLAAVLGLTSRSSIGRVASLWFPVAMFFALGLEHSVVNMFIIPMGMMLGAPVSIPDWLIWNALPVTLGNIIGAGAVVAGVLHFSAPKSADS